MRKKIMILSAIGALLAISMNDSSINKNNTLEDVGCASNCVRKTRNLVSAMAEYANINPNYYVDNGLYDDLYTNCYYQECQ